MADYKIVYSNCKAIYFFPEINYYCLILLRLWYLAIKLMNGIMSKPNDIRPNNKPVIFAEWI